MKKKFNAAKQKRKLDRLFSKYILNRDNRTCQWCGMSEIGKKYDTAHIIPREIMATRYNENNAVCLCFKCHINWHNSPLHAAEFIEKKYGKEFVVYLLEISKLPYTFNEETAQKELCRLVSLSNKT